MSTQSPLGRAAAGVRIADPQLAEPLAHFNAIGHLTTSDRWHARTVAACLILDDAAPPDAWDWLLAREAGQHLGATDESRAYAARALDALALSWCEQHGRAVHRSGGPDGLTRWTVAGEVYP